MLVALSPRYWPYPVHRLLLRSERYRGWCMRRPDSRSGWPTQASVPHYPAWAREVDDAGYSTHYTCVGATIYRLNENVANYMTPRYEVELERWGPVTSYPFGNPMPLIGGIHIGWEVIRTERISDLDTMLALSVCWRLELPQLLMEEAL